MDIDLTAPLPSYPEGFRSGFASLVGRPNAGKSTLTNALVGQKVAITSNRPQTTRHTIRGIVHKDDYQLILIDTPGIHRPRTPIGGAAERPGGWNPLTGGCARVLHPRKRENRPRRPVHRLAACGRQQ